MLVLHECKVQSYQKNTQIRRIIKMTNQIILFVTSNRNIFILCSKALHQCLHGRI